MRKISLFIFMLLLSVAVSAQTTTKKAKINYAKEGYVKATVVKFEVESCGYILQLADKKNLMPEGLTDEFKKNKLKVWVKYSVPKRQPITTCMAGQSIVIEQIVKR